MSPTTPATEHARLQQELRQATWLADRRGRALLLVDGVITGAAKVIEDACAEAELTEEQAALVGLRVLRHLVEAKAAALKGLE